jgi:hypothetical protein
MALAVAFAIGKYLELPTTMDLATMIRLHGAANATFALGSLVGWTVEAGAPAAPRS